MAIARKLPIGYYVYTITVDDVVRYIGKGKGLRLYCHMKEVRSRLNRDYRLQNIGSRLQPDRSVIRPSSLPGWPGAKPPLIIQQKNSGASRYASANYNRTICQLQKFTLRYNGKLETCEIGKLIDLAGFSLFPRERQ
jgi:hypothetical protein